MESAVGREQETTTSTRDAASTDDTLKETPCDTGSLHISKDNVALETLPMAEDESESSKWEASVCALLHRVERSPRLAVAFEKDPEEEADEPSLVDEGEVAESQGPNNKEHSAGAPNIEVERDVGGCPPPAKPDAQPNPPIDAPSASKPLEDEVDPTQDAPSVESTSATAITTSRGPSLGGATDGADAAQDVPAIAQDVPAVGKKSSGATSPFAVGTRVRVQQPGKAVNGMVAVVGMLSVVVAADDGTWPSIDLCSVEETLSLQTQVVTGRRCVVALTFGQDNQTVTGSLFGSSSGESLFGGYMAAYMAHVAREVERDSRLRDRNERAALQSFCIGDIVQQIFQPNDEGAVEEGLAPAFAAVVRVAYSRRNTSQTRKLLILLELPDGPQALPKAEVQTFFPGSWTNWSRVAKKTSTSAAGQTHEVMPASDIRTIDQESDTF